MRNNYLVLPNTQRGATLLLALLILIMIMMHGIPTVMNNTLNERMAGNTRQRDLAFQFAEHALSKADAWILSKTAATLNSLAPASTACPSGNTDPNTTDCVLPDGQCHANDIAYWRAFNWEGNNVCTSMLVGALPNGDATTRYIVERMPDFTYCESTGEPPPSGSSCTGATITKSYYRITARGVGQDSNAAVILQTMYEFTN